MSPSNTAQHPSRADVPVEVSNAFPVLPDAAEVAHLTMALMRDVETAWTKARMEGGDRTALSTGPDVAGGWTCQGRTHGLGRTLSAYRHPNGLFALVIHLGTSLALPRLDLLDGYDKTLNLVADIAARSGTHGFMELEKAEQKFQFVRSLANTPAEEALVFLLALR